MSKLISRFHGVEAVRAELERNPSAEEGAAAGISLLRLFETPIGYQIEFTVDDREFPELGSYDNQNFFFWNNEKQFVYSLPPNIPYYNRMIPYVNHNKDEMRVLLARLDILHPELNKD